MNAPPLQIPVRRLPNGEGLPLPEHATPGSAGLDLRAAIDRDITLESLERALVPTGLAIALPTGYEGQVRPRSGLAVRTGLTVLNTPGTVDSDYRGEVCVLLVNLGSEPVTVTRGERIAQLVVARHARVELVEAPELPDTVRGDGGFGHTGSR
jgi:dUTP pyrophosphatase